jgi:hypothetical protein
LEFDSTKSLLNIRQRSIDLSQKMDRRPCTYHDDQQYRAENRTMGDHILILLCGLFVIRAVHLSDPAYRFKPDVLEWETPAAKQCWEDLKRAIDQKISEDAGKRDYLDRMAEIALRLATVCAAGRDGPKSRISVADMGWGAGLAHAAVTTMMERSKACLPQTPRGELAGKILDRVRAAGSMSRRELQRFLGSRYGTRELDDIMATLVEEEYISRQHKGQKGVRSSIVYTALNC